MLSPQAVISGLVSRLLPSLNADGGSNDIKGRQDGYGGFFSQPRVRKAHVLVDEGCYYTTHNNQTGIVPTYGTAFAATNPFITVFNGNSIGATSPKVALDYAALVAIAAGASTTTAGYIALAIVLDSGDRYSSGGTDLTANIGNAQFTSGQNSGVKIRCGAITATAATAQARTLVGVRNIRPSVSATVINVVGDMNLLNFGGVEGAVGSIVIANANIMPQPLPAVVVPPQQSALIYIWFPVMTAPSAATFAPEVGFWVS